MSQSHKKLMHNCSKHSGNYEKLVRLHLKSAIRKLSCIKKNGIIDNGIKRSVMIVESKQLIKEWELKEDL